MKLPDHSFNLQDSQFLIIPSFGCSYCIETAIELQQSKSIINTYVISNVSELSELNDQDELYYDSSELLNDINFGVTGKPLFLQISDGQVIAILPVTPQKEDYLEEVIKYDQLIGNTSP